MRRVRVRRRPAAGRQIKETALGPRRGPQSSGTETPVAMRKAQSAFEYAIIVAVVAAAVAALTAYFTRSVNAKVEELRQEYRNQ